MLRFLEARQLVLDSVAPPEAWEAPLAEALGLAAARDIHAPEPVPPFTNSAMDGFALRWEDTARASEAAPVRLRVAGRLAAGQVEEQPLRSGTALRIMTGAPLPPGADTVVPLEQVRVEGDWVILERPIRMGANVRRAGEDIPEGGRVLEVGTALGPSEIAVLAATGFDRVPAFSRPRVAVLTTGDELVPCGERPGPGQIRDANLPALSAQLAAFGALPVPFPRVPDGPEALRAVLERALEDCDVVLTTGGVSVGDCDFVKPVLEALGARNLFWRVAQKPGGPLGFWLAGAKPVFGIPGNPVAAMLMVETYVRPALRKLMGFHHLHRPEQRAVLEGGWRKSGADGRVHFLRVAAWEEEGRWRAALTGPQGSGILSSMLRANALAVIPEEQTEVPEGGEVLLHLTDRREDR
jgi:molybdopterin molybdotransferase